MKGRAVMKSLFAGDNPRCCACCLRGKTAPQSGMILCPRRGVVPESYFCKKYRYDPLKRVPRRAPELPSFSPDDFRLD